MNTDAPKISPPSVGAAYPVEYQTTASFRGPVRIRFRPIKPEDADLLREFFRSHSAQTILYRYFTPLHELPPEMLRQFVNLDFRNDMAIVGFVPFDGREKMVCVGRYCRNPDADDAEIAITIHDDWQRHGIGTYLIHQLTSIAGDHGITGFTADVLADNHGMLRLIRKNVKHVKSTVEAGVYHFHWILSDGARPARSNPKAGK